MAYRHTRNAGVKYMLAGGSVIAALGLLIEPQSLLQKFAPSKDACQEVIQPKAVLSRDQLSQLLTVPERSSQEQIRQLMKEPYCRLPDVQVRAGVMARREVYPLAFDPQTWFVVLYEGGEYAGYSFSFRH
jgi:hypothetical protein